eukprot:1232168-Amorphochlora_amoeboformis.AAC.1
MGGQTRKRKSRDRDPSSRGAMRTVWPSSSRLEREAISALFVLSGSASRDETKAMRTLHLMSSFTRETIERRSKRKKRTIMLSPPPGNSECTVSFPYESSTTLERKGKRSVGFVLSHRGTDRMRKIGCPTSIVQLKTSFPQYEQKVVVGTVVWRSIVGSQAKTAVFAFGKADQAEVMCPSCTGLPANVIKIEITLQAMIRDMDDNLTLKKLRARVNTDACIARNFRQSHH